MISIVKNGQCCIRRGGEEGLWDSYYLYTLFEIKLSDS